MIGSSRLKPGQIIPALAYTRHGARGPSFGAVSFFVTLCVTRNHANIDIIDVFPDRPSRDHLRLPRDGGCMARPRPQSGIFQSPGAFRRSDRLLSRVSLRPISPRGPARACLNGLKEASAEPSGTRPRLATNQERWKLAAVCYSSIPDARRKRGGHGDGESGIHTRTPEGTLLQAATLTRRHPSRGSLVRICNALPKSARFRHLYARRSIRGVKRESLQLG